MREKVRIQRILSLLETIWQKQPDMRFNQLVSNLQQMYSTQNEGYGRRKVKEQDFSGEDVDTSYLDFFYLEDAEWESFLESIVGKIKSSEEHEELENNSMESKFETADSHEECSHFLIQEKDKEKLSALNLLDNKLYPLHYDTEEDDYYVVNENGESVYSIDVAVHVKMLKRFH